MEGRSCFALFMLDYVFDNVDVWFIVYGINFRVVLALNQSQHETWLA